jgi:hypothetical protein
MGKVRKNLDHLVKTWENLSYIEKLDISQGEFNVNVIGYKNLNVLKPIIKKRKKILDYDRI